MGQLLAGAAREGQGSGGRHPQSCGTDQDGDLHVYEKANEAAIVSAKEGATSEDRRVWISSEIRGKWAKNLAKLTIKGFG
ncbi:hypothetical protein NL676_019062 [Syzygium grande]|nr:hypothetical protein NL676_019062 [Syzygium grande]